MKSVTTKFKSGGLHEKHVVATWNLGNHLSICFWAQGNQEKPVSRWPVAGPVFKKLGDFHLLCVIGDILLLTFLSLVIDVYTCYLIQDNCIRTVVYELM